MEIAEGSPRWRQGHCLAVGLLCVAPVAALAGRTALAGTLMIVAGAVLLLLKQLNGSDRGKQAAFLVASKMQRAIRLLLIVAGTGLAGIACLLLAIPQFPAGARPWAYDAAAIATMKHIAEAQALFRSNARIDRDGDGVGEFGYFSELAMANPVHPPQLSPAFAKSRSIPAGVRVVKRGGFYFLMYLLNFEGDGLTEGAPNAGVPDPDQSESRWCCYAWPVSPNDSGKRVLFVNQDGVVFWRYFRGGFRSGQVPAFDAAFARRDQSSSNPRDAVGSVIADGVKGRDGCFWNAIR